MALVGFSEVPTSLLLILLNFSTSYPNLFVPPLLIPLQTSRKAASLKEDLFYDGWLSSSLGTSPSAGPSSGSMAWEVEEGETALEEMEMEMVEEVSFTFIRTYHEVVEEEAMVP